MNRIILSIFIYLLLQQDQNIVRQLRKKIYVRRSNKIVPIHYELSPKNNIEIQRKSCGRSTAPASDELDCNYTFRILFVLECVFCINQLQKLFVGYQLDFNLDLTHMKTADDSLGDDAKIDTVSFHVDDGCKFLKLLLDVKF